MNDEQPGIGGIAMLDRREVVAEARLRRARKRVGRSRRGASLLLILGWHSVDPTWSFSGLPEQRRALFHRQLQWLDRRTTVLPLVEALDRAEQGELPPRAVVLSFDDGYRDTAEFVAPALGEYGLPATFFLVPELLSGGEAWWEDLAAAFRTTRAPSLEWHGKRLDVSTPQARRRAHSSVLPGLKALGHVDRVDAVARMRERMDPAEPTPRGLFLDWEGARRLVGSGQAVGSHTMSHAILARESAADQLDDLQRSRRVLAEHLGTTIDTLAYPNGTTADFDDRTIEASRTAGYRCALTTAPGLAGPGAPFALRRLIIDPTTDVRSLTVRAVGMVENRVRRRVSGRRKTGA